MREFIEGFIDVVRDFPRPSSRELGQFAGCIFIVMSITSIFIGVIMFCIYLTGGP